MSNSPDDALGVSGGAHDADLVDFDGPQGPIDEPYDPQAAFVPDDEVGAEFSAEKITNHDGGKNHVEATTEGEEAAPNKDKGHGKLETKVEREINWDSEEDEEAEEEEARRRKKRKAGDKKEGRSSGGRLTKLTKRKDSRQMEEKRERKRREDPRREEAEDDGRKGQVSDLPDGEEDVEGIRMKEDDDFIDDVGVAEEEGQQEGAGAGGYDSEEDRRSIGDAPQAIEEKEHVPAAFGPGRRKKQELTEEVKALMVEEFQAKMDRAAEDDVESNRAGQPAIAKLRMLPKVIEMLKKRPLQRVFLDRGVFSRLKMWLEPLPDWSLPNIKIRTAVLQLLKEMPIDVGNNSERRRQLKESGLGTVVMFLCKLPEETQQNKKLALHLVETWSRPIFEKSTNYRDLKELDYDRPQATPPSHRRRDDASERNQSASDDLDLDLPSGEPAATAVPSGRRQMTRVPEPMAMDFRIRPESRVPGLREYSGEGGDARGGVGGRGVDDRHMKLAKKLQKMGASKKKNLRAEKVSVEGRGMVKYL